MGDTSQFFIEDMKRSSQYILFTAILEDIKSGHFDSNNRYYTSYSITSLNDFDDSCFIRVGMDAQFVISLSNVSFIKNPLEIKKPQLLFLNIHSVSKSLINEQDKGRFCYFVLAYSNKIENRIEFDYLYSLDSNSFIKLNR